ncbi:MULTISPECIES: cold-shock protein [Pseudomonas fluorescens group]|uniref:CspG protein n=1 Tax=Pseudomonas fluorescens TaxID=294 RepID=A0A0D0TP73_PSEFL|nr:MULTISPECIES: cold-shock protein [Pseudomonas fluorescens group]AZE62726.1 Cold shock protein of CSP family [Pseudomonas synxantha]KIR23649.1 Cold shock-like protein CspG [Pseudomonas fluorescens]
MSRGIVKWFDDAKGFGIITSDDGGEELFAHFKSIHGDGFETLREGQKVEFQIKQGREGLHADFIRPVLEG